MYEDDVPPAPAPNVYEIRVQLVRCATRRVVQEIVIRQGVQGHVDYETANLSFDRMLVKAAPMTEQHL